MATIRTRYMYKTTFKTRIKIIDWLHWYTMCSLFHHGIKICLENPVLSMYYHVGMMTVNRRSVLWKHVILVWKTGLRTFVWDASSPHCSQLVCPLALSPDPVVSWAWETVTRSDKFKREKRKWEVGVYQWSLVNSKSSSCCRSANMSSKRNSQLHMNKEQRVVVLQWKTWHIGW